MFPFSFYIVVQERVLYLTILRPTDKHQPGRQSERKRESYVDREEGREGERGRERKRERESCIDRGEGREREREREERFFDIHIKLCIISPENKRIIIHFRCTSIKITYF